MVSMVSMVSVVSVVTVVSIPSMDWAGRWTLVWRGALATIRRTNPQTNHHAVSAVRVVSAVQTEEKREKREKTKRRKGVRERRGGCRRGNLVRRWVGRRRRMQSWIR